MAAPHPKPKGKGEKSEKGDKSEKSDKGKEKSQPSPEPPAIQEVGGLLGNWSATVILIFDLIHIAKVKFCSDFLVCYSYCRNILYGNDDFKMT